VVNISSLETTFGTLWLAANEHGLCRLALPATKEHERFHQWVARRTSFPLSLDSPGRATPLGGSQAGGRGPGRGCLPTPHPQNDYGRSLSLTLFHEGRENKILALAKAELSEYLTGRRHHFTVPLDLDGSAFFRQVWEALFAIPYGGTLTYAALAAQLHRPRAFRAVGSACAKNPMPLIIPCHRAVGSNGSLTGFAGGLAMKESLLRMEGAIGKV